MQRTSQDYPLQAENARHGDTYGLRTFRGLVLEASAAQPLGLNQWNSGEAAMAGAEPSLLDARPRFVSAGVPQTGKTSTGIL